MHGTQRTVYSGLYIQRFISNIRFPIFYKYVMFHKYALDTSLLGIYNKYAIIIIELVRLSGI